MVAPDPIRGNQGIVFTLGAVDYTGVKRVEITSEDKDDSDLTFEEAAEGETKDYRVQVTALQSTAAGSLWVHLWENPSAEETLIYGPHGNAAPSVDQPHFEMTVRATGKPQIGGEAKRTKERYSFEYELEVVSGPTLVTI